MTDLFGRPDPADQGRPPEAPGRRPLADRVRPRTLDEVFGQQHLTGPESLLRKMIAAGSVPSLILWGPPGSGKTTLAQAIAREAGGQLVSHSAVLSGVKEIRGVVDLARRRQADGQGPTLLFVDEIHRFNRTQQDAFLPHVEAGTVTLLGATTENPSFEVNAALLSRCRVVVLEPLAPGAIRAILQRALDRDAELAAAGVQVQPAVLARLAAASRGDARQALGALEAAVAAAVQDGRGSLREEDVEELLASAPLQYDRAGEEHYNLLSALHKSLRNSDADAAVYWLVRMLRSGEDPQVVARRLVRFASEDVGLADPQALPLAVAAREAAHFLGLPEGGLALVEAAVYLAAAPKSNALDRTWARVVEDLDAGRAGPVPLNLRNAPTRLMRELGYGRGYHYAHDEPEQTAAMECLPESVRGRRYVDLGEAGREKEIAAALAAWARSRRRARPR